MISRRRDVMSGRYCLAGTRMPVSYIKDMAKAWTADEIIEEFPFLTREQIAAAVAFRSKR